MRKLARLAKLTQRTPPDETTNPLVRNLHRIDLIGLLAFLPNCTGTRGKAGGPVLIECVLSTDNNPEGLNRGRMQLRAGIVEFHLIPVAYHTFFEFTVRQQLDNKFGLFHGT
jgi:hypothetical protein